MAVRDVPTPPHATMAVGADATLAPTSYARARLLRRLYASGLFTDDAAELMPPTDALPRGERSEEGIGLLS